jgi:hypothetical protein
MTINCGQSVSVYNYPATTSPALPCGTLAFSQILAATGSTTLLFKNSSATSEYLSVILMPGTSAGTYDATKAAKLDMVIRPIGWQVGPTVISPANVILPPTSANNLPTTSNPNQTGQTTSQTIFKRALDIGSRGTDVTALQKYFQKDPTNYPGALVTGYFGTLTQKFVKTFQVLNSIAKAGDSGYGVVGPKTRAKLNLLTN